MLSSEHLVIRTDKGGYLVDIKSAMMAGNDGSKVPKLKPHIKEVIPQLDPGDKINDFWLQIMNGFIIMEIENGDQDENNTILQCQYLKTILNNTETRLMTVRIHPNPEFFNTSWSDICPFFHSGMLFLVLKSRFVDQEDSELYKDLCLVALRVNNTTNSLDLVSKSLFSIDTFAIASTPSFLEYRFNMKNYPDGFWYSKGRIFSFASVSDTKTCLWIHCFHKNTFMPIGGANTTVPGMYQFASRTVVEMDTLDSAIRSQFTLEMCAKQNNQHRVYRTSRLYLRF